MSIDPSAGPRDVLAALRDGRIQGGEKRLRAAAQLMEGVFYQQLFKAMRDTVPEGGAISESQGQEMFEGLLDERMAESAATTAERGLGEALYRHFSRQLGLTAPPESTGAESDPSTAPASTATAMAPATGATTPIDVG